MESDLSNVSRESILSEVFFSKQMQRAACRRIRSDGVAAAEIHSFMGRDAETENCYFLSFFLSGEVVFIIMVKNVM